jgi:hypothetical protein
MAAVAHRSNQVGIPAVASRGGTWRNGTQAGIFFLDLSSSPEVFWDDNGFRCVISK